MTAQYEKQILTLAKICVADQVARNPSQRDPDFVLEDATKAIEYMDTTLPCGMCGSRFDPHSSPHYIVHWPRPEYPSDKEPLWLCDNCVTANTTEELAEHLDFPVEHVQSELGGDGA